ncbi:hypothetical protein [Mycobacterium sp.]|uniref:hypothetical protein n=1 Tax=Mycobacterium sp. TaxID=1785 RepID=UPI003F96460C
MTWIVQMLGENRDLYESRGVGGPVAAGAIGWANALKESAERARGAAADLVQHLSANPLLDN